MQCDNQKDSNDLWTKLPVGTIVDSDLILLINKNQLIIKNADKDMIKQACYDLRVGSTYFDVLHADIKKDVINDGILIKPKQCIIILTEELVDIPHDCIGKVLTKGRLFAVGLSAVNTYLDPGFCGTIGIVLHNLSNDYLRIPKGYEIAKVEFSKLPKAVSSPYKAKNLEEEDTWRIPKTLIVTEKINNKNNLQFDIEAVRISHGETFAILLERFFKVEKYLLFTVCCTAILLTLVTGIVIFYPEHSKIVTTFWGYASTFLLGIVSTVFVNYVMAPFKKGKK